MLSSASLSPGGSLWLPDGNLRRTRSDPSGARAKACPALAAASQPHVGIDLRAVRIPRLTTGNDVGPRRSDVHTLFSRRRHHAPPVSPVAHRPPSHGGPPSTHLQGVKETLVPLHPKGLRNKSHFPSKCSGVHIGPPFLYMSTRRTQLKRRLIASCEQIKVC